MNLRSIRKEKNISVPKLVEMSGIHYRTIQDIEKRGDCLVSTAKKLAATLDVTLNELCGDLETNPCAGCEKEALFPECVCLIQGK